MDVPLRKFPSRLMHQQLYLMGRDIDSRHGNLLQLFGAKRTESPYEGVPSLYQFTLSRKSRICFRGFGVFVGDDRVGGIFVDRYMATPAWTANAKFQPIAWIPKDLKRLRQPRNPTDLRRANRLYQELVTWFIDYENWIRTKFTRRYRASQLSHFRRIGNEVVYWDSVAIWQNVAVFLDGLINQSPI